MKRIVITLTVSDDVDVDDLAVGIDASLGEDATVWEYAEFWSDVNDGVITPERDNTELRFLEPGPVAPPGDFFDQVTDLAGEPIRTQS